MSRKHPSHTLDPMEATSDSMVEIQIEESLVRETLMTIDSANSREDFMTLAGFFCVIAITALSGLYGPPVSATIRKEDLVIQSSVQSLRYASNSISPLNRFVSFAVMLNRKDASHASKSSLSVSYIVECKYDGFQVEFKQDELDKVPFHAKAGASTTDGFEFFNCESVLFNDIIVTVKLTGDLDSYSSVILEVVTGSSDHTIFQIYVRLLFSVFAVVFFILFIFRLRSMPIKLWHLEQRLTVPLLAFDCLFCDPFFAINAYFPSPQFLVYDSICAALFKAYRCFFVLALFDSLRYKNRRTDKCFGIPKIIFTVALFLALTSRAHSAFETVLWVAYYIWAISSIVAASFQVDITERYKFNMYLIAVASSMAMAVLSNLLFGRLNWLSGTSVHFALSFAVDNMFVLLMACYHWPYEVLHDQGFVESTSSPDVHEVQGLFLNIESDNQCL